MGNFGYIFGYCIIFAFLLGGLIGYAIRSILNDIDKKNKLKNYQKELY